MEEESSQFLLTMFSEQFSLLDIAICHTVIATVVFILFLRKPFLKMHKETKRKNNKPNIIPETRESVVRQIK